jgi:hypothetical protein
MGTIEQYQTCFADTSCFKSLRERGSKDPAQYINIWIFAYNKLPHPSVPQVGRAALYVDECVVH